MIGPHALLPGSLSKPSSAELHNRIRRHALFGGSAPFAAGRFLSTPTHDDLRNSPTAVLFPSTYKRMVSLVSFYPPVLTHISGTPVIFPCVARKKTHQTHFSAAEIASSDMVTNDYACSNLRRGNSPNNNAPFRGPLFLAGSLEMYPGVPVPGAQAL